MQKRSSGGEKLRTAVRQLQPNELFALTAENDRLVKLEKDLAEREASVSKREQERQDALEEATRLAQLNHPHIVRYFTCCEFKQGKIFAIVMELLAGGSLAERMRRRLR